MINDLIHEQKVDILSKLESIKENDVIKIESSLDGKSINIAIGNILNGSFNKKLELNNIEVPRISVFSNLLCENDECHGEITANYKLIATDYNINTDLKLPIETSNKHNFHDSICFKDLYINLEIFDKNNNYLKKYSAEIGLGQYDHHNYEFCPTIHNFNSIEV
ncbi:hypothetical protein [Wolbachia endosymbiont of Pentidionis agamae]|uniref:hypothetical protein n=1 Tax=Wolbachia endosymbiont of Pentidionis agamae TaxID=3110435 RepID=UPI002FCFEBD2